MREENQIFLKPRVNFFGTMDYVFLEDPKNLTFAKVQINFLRIFFKCGEKNGEIL